MWWCGRNINCCEGVINLSLTNQHQSLFFCYTFLLIVMPSVLWRCWLGGRKGIRPVKKLSAGMLAWLSVWSEVQTCIWPSWCHCHSLSLASVKSRLVIPFWYRLTRVCVYRVWSNCVSISKTPDGSFFYKYWPHYPCTAAHNPSRRMQSKMRSMNYKSSIYKLTLLIICCNLDVASYLL